MAITLPMAELQAIYEDAVDALIETVNATPCKVIYPSKKVECANCTFLRMGSGSGTNVYKSGGPIPFSIGVCPLCGGTGFKEQSATENITARFYHDSASFRKFINNSTAIAESDGLLLGYMSDMPKILRMEKIQVGTNIEGVKSYFFYLNGEPYKHGFGNKYFYAMLKRASDE